MLFDQKVRSSGTHGTCYFVTSDGKTLDWVEYFDTSYLPSYGWLPEDSLEDIACRRWRNNVVAYTFYLHLGACEAGKVAP